MLLYYDVLVLNNKQLYAEWRTRLMRTTLLRSLIIAIGLLSAQFAAAVAPTPDEMALSRKWAAARFEAGKDLRAILLLYL